MMRQYELVERVAAYKPNLDEALLNRAYVYAMQKHGSQMRVNGDPYFSHPLEVAALLVHVGFLDHDEVEAGRRVELDGAHLGALAHDLPVDLALGRDVDDHVALQRGLAGEAATGG